MKNAIFFFVLSMTALPLCAQPVDTVWTWHGGGAEIDFLHDIIPALDGGWIALGEKNVPGFGMEIWLVKVDDNGQTVWTRSHPLIGEQSALDIVADSASSRYAIAAQVSSGAISFLIVNSNGDYINSTGYSAGFGLFLKGLSLADHGGYYVVGDVLVSFMPPTINCWVTKTDNLGNPNWTRYLDFSSTVTTGGSSTAADGGVVVCGTNNQGLGFVSKVSAENVLLWLRTYAEVSRLNAVAVGATDGALFFAGRSAGSDIAVLRTDGSGNNPVSHTFTSPDLDDCYDIAVTPDGGAIISGYQNPPSGRELCLIKCSANLDSEWTYTNYSLPVESAEGIVAVDNASFRTVSNVGNDGWILDFREACIGVPPAPANVVVQIIGNDAHIHWQPVPVDSSPSCSYGVRAYILYYSQFAGGPYYFLNYVYGRNSSSFIHDNVALFSPAMHYNITAYNGPPPTLLRLAERAQSEPVSESSVHQLLLLP